MVFSLKPIIHNHRNYITESAYQIFRQTEKHMRLIASH